MSLRFPIGSSRIPWIAFCGLLFWTMSLTSMAQGPRRFSNQHILPRVGTIKNYPATGLMTGCANVYAYPVRRTNPSPEAYVFLSSGDGSNAWMNLDGRDVGLQQIKPSFGKERKTQQYSYRLGTLRISVVIEAFKSNSRAMRESDPMFKMKITLRRGRARRIVRARADSDC